MSAVADPAVLEDRFLDEIRRRVAWQASAAARLRERPVEAGPVDPLDLAALQRLVAARPEARRHREWTAFLAELAELTDSDGRLPENLQGLVTVVLAELL